MNQIPKIYLKKNLTKSNHLKMKNKKNNKVQENWTNKFKFKI